MFGKNQPNRIGQKMMIYSDANIDITAPAVAAIVATFGLIALATALVALVRTGRGVDCALRNGYGRLRLNLGHSSQHGVLGHGARKNGRWDGGGLA